jgi:2-desacetyl-2-hydroxyethyl bacteriochlorophyllide A dehydrogenase
MTREIPGNTSPGAYAEYCSVRTDMLRRIPESVSDLEGAMVEPLAVAMHSLNQADLQPGERLLVIGGGPIGILSAKCAALKNIEAVALSEVSEQRLAAAEKMSEIDMIFRATEKGISRKMVEFSGGGFDAVIESSGSEAGIGTALRVLKPRGRLVLTGISMLPQQVTTMLVIAKEIKMMGAYAYHPSEVEECIELIAHKKLNVADMGLKRISLEQVPSAIEELASGKAEALKYVIVYK